MRTKPPCMKPNGEDCPHRHVGCRADCTEWNEWMIIHSKEKDTILRNKKKYNECNTFEVDRIKRNTATIQERSSLYAKNGIKVVKNN